MDVVSTLTVFLSLRQKCPHKKPTVKNKIDAIMNTVTEETTAAIIFPSLFNPSVGLLPLKFVVIWVS